jgi:hydroxymethylpyrimidine pyrophosphatase-like HAD family hydrolase
VNLGDKRPKLIATDLDGTIVHHEGTITERTLAAFARARDLGVDIWFVTGRPPRWMGEIKDAFGYGNAICCNGAMHYDLLKGNVIEEWAIPHDLLLKTIQRLRQSIRGVSFAVESHNYFKREKSYVASWDAGIDHGGCNNIEEVLTVPILKVLVRCSGHEFTSDEMLEIAIREIGDLVTVTATDAKPYFLFADQPNSAYSIRKTRAGDAFDKLGEVSCATDDSSAGSVNLGLPTLRAR